MAVLTQFCRILQNSWKTSFGVDASMMAFAKFHVLALLGRHCILHCLAVLFLLDIVSADLLISIIEILVAKS